ncbi:MAG TPA: ABC transporter ATP-binding protein [Bryobacteraceae bacterium]|nr:ABC transporter ATP-binding protein [Bryobacteraceae bacterium]
MPAHRWLLKTLRPFRASQLLITFSLLSAGLLSSVDPLIIKWLIDHGFRGARVRSILMALGLFVLAYSVRLTLLMIGNMAVAVTCQRVMLRLRLQLATKLTQCGAGYFDRQPVGDLVYRLEGDIEQVGHLATDVLPSLLRVAASALLVAGIMVSIDPMLACVTLPFFPLFLVLRARFRPKLERAAEATRDVAGQRSSYLTEWLAGVVQIQLLGAERTFLRKLFALCSSTIRAAVSQRRTELLYAIGSMGLIALATIAVLGAGAERVLTHALTLGGYVAFYTYLTRLFEALSASVETYWQLKRATGSVRRLMELEDVDIPIVDVKSAPSLPAGEVGGLACTGVDFGYPAGRIVIQGVSLQVNRGDRVAIVGRSGSGKSTLAKLLVRLYDVSGGAILLDGEDIRDLRLRSVRSSIALVSQNPTLFAGTLAENARLGSPDASLEDMNRLAVLTCFDEVLQRFPDGWRHVLGPAGAGLSGGEKKRLALLRGLLLNREVLVLDEVTSELDPAVERVLLSHLDEYAHDKAIVLITHRTAAALWADRIIALQDGRVTRVWRRSELDEDDPQLERKLWGEDLAIPTEEAYRPESELCSIL